MRFNAFQVQRFLNVRHGRQYRVYNLCSERSYPHERFKGSVGHYPFDDHNPPSLQMLRACCDDILSWLGPAEERSQRVAAIHCKVRLRYTHARLLHSRPWRTGPRPGRAGRAR